MIYIPREQTDDELSPAGNFIPGEIKAAILQRIERLGKMNDRRMLYIKTGDRMALLELAEEYETLGRYGCPRLAETIRREAQENV